ncbi:outer membrane lipoprotein carrier protein LolA [Empedobacter brevis]|uniref:LolA family protein n=1 Tax=Empedobacter brevis TaxID=247 RepID=UPI00123D34AA|nr:outer membrane lipoprotein carrier protein LolA [Empedobacter brevis]QES92532.1 outer membrane lipoprotein carrier protein LolA [Empedobacter brevis]
MKKLIYSFILLLVGVGTLNAQSAKQILDKVYAKYTNANSYYIKFDFSHVVNGKSTNRSGEVFSMKQKFNLNVGDINQIYTGTKLYTISKDDKEVTISNASNTDDFLTPTKVLNTYRTDFSYTLTDKKTIGGNTIQYIKLTPTKNSTIKYSVLGINMANNQIYDYKEYGKNGDTTSIVVKDYVQNLLIHKSYFNFDQKKYKSQGYIITQL